MIEAKETVVGSLGATKQSLRGTTNASSTYTSEYKLPIASETILGGVMVGEDLNIDEYGKLNAIVPKKVSELTNDSGYLTEIPSEYITDIELAQKNYLTSVPSEYKTKAENDDLYQHVGDYALKSDLPEVPTKVSDLENDSGFISEVPDEYKTKTENDALYQPIGDYASKSDIPTVPTKTSELENDRGYLTEHQDISNLATKEELHTHSNKTILDNITQENIDKWNTGGIAEESDPTVPDYVKNITQEEIDKWNSGTGGDIDLSGYATKEELSNKVDKVSGKSLISDSEITRLASVTNYDDTAIKNTLNSKANTSDLHSHSNKSVLDSITQANINSWNNNATTNMMTIKKTTKQNLTKEAYDKVLFDVSSSIGSKLTFTSNGIKIGSGVSKVKISGFATVQNSVVGVIHMKIVKNSNTNENTLFWLNDICAKANWSAVLTLPQSITEVNAGDVIYVYIYISGTGGVGSDNGVPTANLTVEVIE